MECNKDEAFRAKEIAERKISEKDYAGAKKFTLKAQNLYPGLDGLDQMLRTIDVYISAENKIDGEGNWYGILGVNPFSDEETVKKQYRKMALLLHPDKNKSAGADGAFKLISEAWSFLSDKAKRLTYNEKLNSRGIPRFPTQSGISSVPPRANGSHKTSSNANVTSNSRMQNSWSQMGPSSASTSSNSRMQNSGSQMGPSSVTPPSNSRMQNSGSQMGPSSATPPSNKKPATFWTVCTKCKTQFEYLRIYLNHTLLCPSCHHAFLALEKPPPPSANRSPNWPSRPHHHSSGRHASNSSQFNCGSGTSSGRHASHSNQFNYGGGASSSNSSNFQWGPFSTMPGVNNTGTSSTAPAEAASVQQPKEKLKREREEGRADAEGSRTGMSSKMGNSTLKAEKPLKRQKDDVPVNGYVGSTATQTTMGNGPVMGSVSEAKRSILQTQGTYGFSGIFNKPNTERDLSVLETRKMLVDKARNVIHKKIKESSSQSEAKNTVKEKVREKGSKKQKSEVNTDAHVLDKNKGSATIDKEDQGKKSPHDPSSDDSEKHSHAPVAIDVPDSDFHNFDMDRSESSFGSDQVWAAYDDDDGMPRFYARIHKVISVKPFKMKISWLNSRSNSELGPLDWIGSGFSKTCGEFRTGKREMFETLNSFSHKVQWTKGTRGVIQIFPRKGDVWALYRNWSPDWNEHTPDDVIHKYDMVEVLDDYTEEQGVSVIPLRKVGGFRALFQKHMDPKEVKKIPKEEMFRFSHQVPHYSLSSQEAPNAPIGCLELDPAATPLDLLQVTGEASEAADSQKSAEKMSVCVPEAKEG